MTGLFHNLGFLWSVILTTVLTEKVLPPENVRLGWREGLYQALTWTPPKHSLHNCQYHINSTIRENGSKKIAFQTKSGTEFNWYEYRALNGGFLNISIQTVCNGSSSEAVFIGLDDPDLKLDCAIRSSSLVHCSWKPPPSAQLSLFYNAATEPYSEVFDELRECPQYTELRSGCDLPVTTKHSIQDLSILPINLLLNGTLGNRTIRNVHKIISLKLNLPPLNWTVTESKEKFLINWNPPPFNLNWKYIINYTSCDRPLVSRELSKPPFEFNREAACSYRITMRGVVLYIGGTEWTKEKYFGAASEPNLLLLAVVLIPMVLTVLVVLTLLWIRKNKDRLWPKVPQPNFKLFEDLMNNNNKTNLHLPKAEEECEVTLVVDPKQPEL